MSTNILTEWRRAVMAHLDENLQGGTFIVNPGERDGPSRDRKLCHVFAPPMRTDTGNVNFARPALLVRCWIPKPRQPRNPTPLDPEPLEQLMIDLATTLETIQVQTDLTSGGLYFIVQAIEPDYEDWGVQATLVGWTRNPATIA